MKTLAKVSKLVSEKSLKKEANSICLILYNQPKEPKDIIRFKKK